ncbi:hypothetical protein ACLBOM_12475 [Escherichia coli]
MIAGKEEAHGAPLRKKKWRWHGKNWAGTIRHLGLPKKIYHAWDAREKGEKAQQSWNEKFAAYKKAHPQLAEEFTRRMSGGLPKDCRKRLRNISMSYRQIRRKSLPVRLRKYT